MMLMVSITIFLMLLSITRVFFSKSGAKLLHQTDTRGQSVRKNAKIVIFLRKYATLRRNRLQKQRDGYVVYFFVSPFNFFPFVASYRKRHKVQWYNFCYRTIKTTILCGR